MKLKSNYATVYSYSCKSGLIRSYYLNLLDLPQIIMKWNATTKEKWKDSTWRETKSLIGIIDIIQATENSFDISFGKYTLKFELRAQGLYVITEESLKLLDKITWLEQQIIINSEKKHLLEENY